MRFVMRKEKLSFLWAVAISATFVFADDITLERFPDADAVLVNNIRDAEYFPDGTYTGQRHGESKTHAKSVKAGCHDRIL